MRRILKKAFRQFVPDRRSFVLGYHRVIDLEIDTWDLAVSPAEFEKQIRLIANYAGVTISRSAFSSGKRRVYVVFDDGYVDNLEYALPILKKHGVPATIFLATGFLGTGREYWWDALERILLLPGYLPEVLDIEVQGDPYKLPIGRDARYSREDFDRYRNWRGWMDPPTTRHRLYCLLWNAIYHSNRQYAEEMIAALEEWAGCDPDARKHYAPMTRAQVGQMTGNGISIGAHSVDHLSFNNHPDSVVTEQIFGSSDAIMGLTGAKPKLFSYPFGNTGSGAARSALQAAGFEVAFSTEARKLRFNADPFAAPRYFLGNDGVKRIRQLLR